MEFELLLAQEKNARYIIERAEEKISFDIVRENAQLGVALNQVGFTSGTQRRHHARSSRQHTTTTTTSNSLNASSIAMSRHNTSLPTIESIQQLQMMGTTTTAAKYTIMLTTEAVERRRNRMLLLEQAIRAEIMHEEREEYLIAFDELSMALVAALERDEDVGSSEDAHHFQSTTTTSANHQHHYTEHHHQKYQHSEHHELNLSHTATFTAGAANINAATGEHMSTSTDADAVSAAGIDMSGVFLYPPSHQRTANGSHQLSAMSTSTLPEGWVEEDGYDSVVLGAHVSKDMRLYPCKVRPSMGSRYRSSLVEPFAIHANDVLAAIDGVRMFSCLDVADWEQGYDACLESFLTIIRDGRRRAVPVRIADPHERH